MPFLLRNIRLDLEAPLEELPDAIAKRLRVPRHAIRAYAIVHRSIDARDKDDIHLRFHVELALNEPPDAERKRLRRLRPNECKWLDPSPTAKAMGHPFPTAKAMGHPTSWSRSQSLEAAMDEGDEILGERPIIVGFGPAGMFAALRLAELGYKPIVLERGRDIRRRHKDILQTFYRERIFTPESNLLFGEGGAGAYSDGKLYTRVNDPLVTTILEKLYEHGADPDILIDAHPHIGSDRLPAICRRLRERIESLGGQVRFDARVDDFHISSASQIRAATVRARSPNRAATVRERTGGGADVVGGSLVALTVSGERIGVGPVLLAIGHSARDTIRTLARRGVRIDPKPFQIGVRIEHPQDKVDRWQYGALAGRVGLGPAEYQVVARGAGGESGDLFSFCMCAGGQILPTNESPELIATNGASRAARDGRFANSGLVITVDPASLKDANWRAHAGRVLKRSVRTTVDVLGGGDVTGGVPDAGPASIALAGLDYQEFWERLAYAATGETYRLPVQRASDFLSGRTSDGSCETSYPLGSAWHDLRAILPADVTQALEKGLLMLQRKMPGYAGAEAVITAPETRAGAPIRLTRDRITRQSVSTANLYPIGEGAGYAGGIVSAAIDGWKTADIIGRRFARPA